MQMTIEYSATPTDVGALFAYNWHHLPLYRWLMVGLASTPLVVDVALALLRRRSVAVGDVLFDLALGALLLLGVPWLAKRRTKRDVRVLVIDPEKISTRIGRLSGEVPWRRVASVAVTDEHLFITGRTLNGFAIPTRAFASASDRERFVGLAKQYWADTKGQKH